MANAGPNTNGSQFFLVSGPSGTGLPPQYSLFGQIVKGLDVLDAMQRVKTGGGDRPARGRRDQLGDDHRVRLTDMGALDGRTAIVTGASRGIGAAISVAPRRGRRRGSRSWPAAPTTSSGRPSSSTTTRWSCRRPRHGDGPGRAVEQRVAAFGGRLDVLVNNAGTALRKDSETLTADEMDLLWNVNVRSALLATPPRSRRCSPPASVRSSRSARSPDVRGAPRRALYAATKAALDGMTRSLAMEYGPRGIRANAVAPGVVETDMWPVLADPAVVAEVLRHIPTRRTSTPEEVADAVVFLASDASRAITGETLSADGGIHSTVNLWPSV